MSNKGLNQKFKQGIFSPKNPQKYKGKTPPVYRSSYELVFMTLCDESPLILEWNSEGTVVQYLDQSEIDKNTGGHKVRRYFVDFYFKKKVGDTVKKYLAEIKPSASLTPPAPNPRRKKTSLLFEQATWIKNQCKWQAQRKYAQERDMEFIVITEKHLGISK